MLQLRVEAIQWLTADTATFYLADVSGKKVSYQAGQFITLVFTHHDEEIRRSYSISSSPDEKQLAITVKRIPNGEISRFLLTKVNVGDVLNAAEPAGKFIISNYEAPIDILLFAAGSGITPIFSQLKYVSKRGGASKLTLIYSNTNNNNILFKAELDALQTQHPDRLKIIYLISSQGKRLNNINAEQLVLQNIHHDISTAEFYLCGPFTYMRMVRLTLLFMGIDASRIRKENFVLETIAVNAPAVNYPPKNIRVIYKNETHDLPVGENQTILQAALQNDLQLPYSCKAGICSACTAKCSKGKVDMAVNDVLTDLDLSQGWVLTCTGRPASDDVVIEFL